MSRTRLCIRLFLLAILFPLAVAAEVIAIDGATLVRLMGEGVPVVDIRTEGEWRSTGVIAGSRQLTFFDERGQVGLSAWLAQARKWAPPEQAVILVCRSGNRTREASRMLSEQAAYKKVYHLRTGLSGWASDGRVLSNWRP